MDLRQKRSPLSILHRQTRLLPTNDVYPKKVMMEDMELKEEQFDELEKYVLDRKMCPANAVEAVWMRMMKA